jgi:hypothetical protein
MPNSHARVIEILRLMRRSRAALTLSAISRELQIPGSTAFAILRTLAQHDAVLSTSKRYTVGPAAFYIGSAFVTNSPLYRAVWTDLVHLADELHVSANLTVVWEQHHLVLAVHSSLGIPGLPPEVVKLRTVIPYLHRARKIFNQYNVWATRQTTASSWPDPPASLPESQIDPGMPARLVSGRDRPVT